MKENNPEPSTGKVSSSQVLVPKISGVVSYSFRAECPHCGKRLDLTQWPYDDDQEDYGPAEDELGLALFGRTTEPAQWSGLGIEYKCCSCKEHFLLETIEI